MKICIDLTALADNLSGIERYAACISLEMIKQHEEQYILVFKQSISPLFIDICKQKNVEAIVLPNCNKLLFNQIRLPQALHKIKADWYLFMAFPVPILSFKKNMVETIHDITAWDCPETMNGMSKWYFKFSHLVAVKKCKAIITISEFSKKRIQDQLNYPKEKTWLIYCGIDQSRFCVDSNKFDQVREKYGLPEKYYLTLSTLEPRKNMKILISAYEQLLQEGKKIPPLVLAGRKGWKMEKLLSEIDDKVKGNLYFTGFIDDEDLPEVYGMASFFIFPSLYEGFGIPPLEAMACRTPVLSSNATSLPEVCGDAPIYFESNSVEDLKGKIVEICAIAESKRKELVNLGVSQVSKYKWENEANKLFERLIDSTR